METITCVRTYSQQIMAQVLKRTCVLDFSNTVHKADIERLAELDDHEVVREVQVSWISHDGIQVLIGIE